MNKYIQKITKAVNIDEGAVVVEQFLIHLYLESPISSKELARKLFLPVPLITAIKKEFIKDGLVKQESGIKLSAKGIQFVEASLGFKDIDKDLYKKIIHEPVDVMDLFASEMNIIESIYNARPEVDRSIDQAHCTIETSLKRSLLTVTHHTLVNKQILCVGDDDLVCLAIGILMKKLGVNQKYAKTEIHVLDVDRRLLEFIQMTAEACDLPIVCHYYDTRQTFPPALKGCFDCFFTDPPYTLSGIELFMSRGISGLKGIKGLPIFFSFAHKAFDYTYDIIQTLGSLGLSIHKISPRFNKYIGASVLGSIGQMFVLHTTSMTSSVIAANELFDEGLYTREFYKKNSN